MQVIVSKMNNRTSMCSDEALVVGGSPKLTLAEGGWTTGHLPLHTSIKVVGWYRADVLCGHLRVSPTNNC